MTQFERSLLGDLCGVTAGPSGSLLSTLHDGPDGVPVISPSDLTFDRRVEVRSLRRVPTYAAAGLARFALAEGDIVLVRQGAIGRLGLIGAEQATWFYSSSCVRIRPNTKLVLPEYLASYLSYPPVSRELQGQSIAGTVPSINSAVLVRLPIVLPPLDRQHAIVEALEDVDTQIRIQREMTSRLQALRPAVFGELIDGTRRA